MNHTQENTILFDIDQFILPYPYEDGEVNETDDFSPPDIEMEYQDVDLDQGSNMRYSYLLI